MEKKQKNPMSFEKALGELETIAVKLERGELGLDESIAEFEKGIKYAKYCHDKLEEAERKISILQKGENSVVEKKPVRIKPDTGEIEDDEELQGSLL
ncbi:MAG: exodeoxyribonuclease VII small subunit [Leptospirales bacterium]|nr:exodeoxyribonuclease VII small subunit [Leptospirales bacterium]